MDKGYRGWKICLIAYLCIAYFH